jgi:hypothetical protein
VASKALEDWRAYVAVATKISMSLASVKMASVTEKVSPEMNINISFVNRSLAKQRTTAEATDNRGARKTQAMWTFQAIDFRRNSKMKWSSSVQELGFCNCY